jgi:3'(2'), 5'-bisphosphate nucleotidase
VSHLENLVAPLIELCSVAGESICSHYHSEESDQYEPKSDQSPLTRADLDSHAIILSGLEELDEAIPILSEESTTIGFEQRSAWDKYWLVDPLDGTREFLDRTGEFTINIALVENHVPVLGLLYLPLEKKAYIGIPGSGAHCYEFSPGEGWQARPLQTRTLSSDEPFIILASHRHRGPKLGAVLEWLEQRRGPLKRVNSGSALKFCQLVEGDGDFYPRFSPCCEWDTAAGQALLEAAGGSLLGMDGKPVSYNRRKSLMSPNFFAIGDPQNPLWKELIALEI